MGMRVELAAFARIDVLGLAALLTFAAVVGKQARLLGASGGLDRLSVGIGMVPRGEVGLILCGHRPHPAGIGLTLSVGGERIIDEAVFSAIVVMVVVTTMATHPTLRWSLRRAAGRAAGRPASERP